MNFSSRYHMCDFGSTIIGAVLGGGLSIIATVIANCHQARIQKEMLKEKQNEENRIWLRNKRELLFKTICGALRNFSKIEFNTSVEVYEKNSEVVYLNQDLIKEHIQSLSAVLKNNRDDITLYLPSELRAKLISFDGFVAKILNGNNEMLIKDIPKSDVIEMIKRSENIVAEFRKIMGITD